MCDMLLIVSATITGIILLYMPVMPKSKKRNVVYYARRK